MSNKNKKKFNDFINIESNKEIVLNLTNNNNNNKNKKEKTNKEDINKIICMFCFDKTPRKKEINITSNKIFCLNKGCEFSIIECFHCKKDVYLGKISEDDFIIGNTIKCPYVDCEKYFCYLMCPKCDRFFKRNGQYEEFKELKCPYSDCNDILISYRCLNLNCLKSLFLPKANFECGIKDGCPDCKSYFMYFNCDYCNKRNIIPLNEDNKFNREYIVKCPEEDCLKLSILINCPKCSIIKSLKSEEYILGSNIECENKICKENFYLNVCPICKNMKINEGKINNFLLCNQNITNEFSILKCESIYNYSKCPNCQVKNYFIIEENIKNGKIRNFEINCGNLNCNKTFLFNELNDNNSSSLLIKAKEFDLNLFKFIQNDKRNLYKTKFEKKLNELEKILIRIYKSPFSNIQENYFEEIEKNDEDGNLCKICLHNFSHILYAPCGHLNFCKECHAKLKDECPTCKNKIESFVDILKLNY